MIGQFKRCEPTISNPDQDPNIMQSTIHFGSFPCCDGHNYVHGPDIQSTCDYAAGLHTWTLDWTPNELLYKFDGETMFRHNLNRQIHTYYGAKWTTPYDEYFHVVLNTAIGGDFVDGPDDSDVWNYPDAEFWIDSVTITPLDDIVNGSLTECASDDRCENCRDDTEECSGEHNYLQYHLLDDSYQEMTCVPDDSKSNTDICGLLKYLCHDPGAQNELNLGEQAVCTTPAWGTIGCCYGSDAGASCDRNALLSDATDIFTYRYNVLDRCGNWKWDAGNNDMHLAGDMEVTCPTMSTTTTTTITTTTATPDWVVGKDEEFVDDLDDAAAFTENWNIEVTPNPHNNEYQYYTDRADNVRIQDGKLVLTPLKETFEHRQYTSGRVTSKYAFKYGRIEVVAKAPAGRGLWPAIWLMPKENVYGTWPASGEIDIFEGRGQDQGSKSLIRIL